MVRQRLVLLSALLGCLALASFSGGERPSLYFVITMPCNLSFLSALLSSHHRRVGQYIS